MHRSPRPHHRPFNRHAVAIAMALALSSLAPAQALAAATPVQYYSYGGSVSSGPTDLFPIDTNQFSLDLGSNRLFVGGNAVGSFSALAGAQMSVGQLVAGFGGYGNGSINVSGPLAVVQVGGSGRLDIGSWGTGSLNVSAGAIVNAAVNPADCANPGVYCGNSIGNGAGSTANLLITGVGSEVRTLGFFGVGAAQVNTVANGGFDFGTPGGTTVADIKVLAGGTLRTANTTVGQGAFGQATTGTEGAFATVLIDGPGSQWVVARNTVNNGAALMGIGASASGSGAVTVANGGLLRIDGAGGPGPNDGINIGSSGKGTLVVTGVGSRLETAGLGRFINVGANNAAGDGSFQLLAGGTATSQYVNVGRNGGKGDFLIDGAGSQLTLSGVELLPASQGTAGANIGRNGGIGTATVRNGGRWLITDGGQDSRSVASSPALNVGRDANGNGSLIVTGAGSTVEVISTSLGLAPGLADNFNPFVTVGGRGNGAATTGTLMVSSGGKFIMTGNAVSTVANGHSTSLHIGGRSSFAGCTDCIGTGTATVTGAGSEIIVQGYDAYIGVGRTLGSTGTLNVLDQSKVSSISLVAGQDAIGTINVNNGWIALSGHRTDSSTVGAGVTIGRSANGVGALNLANGSSLTIQPDVLSGGMSVGGDQFNAGGTGTVTLSGGSSILLGGTVASGGISVGRSGVGTMSLTGASLVDVGNTRDFNLATEAGGSGTLSVTGASKLKGNIINIGGTSDTVAGGVGTATVSGLGSEIHAVGANSFVGVGRSAVGTLTVANQGKVAAIAMSVGRGTGGVGTLAVNNATLDLSGQQTTGNFAGSSLYIGLGGGTGSVSITNGSQVTMTNLGTSGATLGLGGAGGTFALGSGTLNVSGGSQIKLVAAAGKALARIGHDGSATASFSGNSLLDVGDGNVIIAGLPGSVATLTLNSGSVLNAGYVGVGSLPGGIDGGSGRLFVNDFSTVNATTVEIGKHSLLGGHLGTVNANVINRGILSPGNSPGVIIINGAFDTSAGSIVLDVQGDTSTGFATDMLVLTDNSLFNFKTSQVSFNFVGNTNPTDFAASGKLDLDNFIQVQDATGQRSGLSSKLNPAGSSWEQAFAGGSFTATSTAYDIHLDLKLDTTGTFGITVTPVPEPQTWALWLLGLAGLGWRSLHRRSAR